MSEAHLNSSPMMSNVTALCWLGWARTMTKSTVRPVGPLLLLLHSRHFPQLPNDDIRDTTGWGWGWGWGERLTADLEAHIKDSAGERAGPGRAAVQCCSI